MQGLSVPDRWGPIPCTYVCSWPMGPLFYASVSTSKRSLKPGKLGQAQSGTYGPPKEQKIQGKHCLSTNVWGHIGRGHIAPPPPPPQFPHHPFPLRLPLKGKQRQSGIVLNISGQVGGHSGQTSCTAAVARWNSLG